MYTYFQYLNIYNFWEVIVLSIDLATISPPVHLFIFFFQAKSIESLLRARNFDRNNRKDDTGRFGILPLLVDAEPMSSIFC